jgi:rSAM/selenodomain-associated transferase 1
MSADRVLVFARRPVPGKVKTRLTPPLAPAEAARIYEACLRDVVTHAARERGRVELWYDGGRNVEAWFAQEFQSMQRARQSSGELGERLADAFARSFADGAERVVILGGDVPTLPETTLTSAFTDLEDADGVVGPSVDGGYVLIALRRSSWPRGATLFQDVPWSTEQVLSVTLHRAQDAGLDMRVLPGWYDVDRVADLVRAKADAAPDSHLGRWLRSDAARDLEEP